MRKGWLSLAVLMAIVALLGAGCGRKEAGLPGSEVASVSPVSAELQPLNYADRFQHNLIYPLRDPFEPLVVEAQSTSVPAESEESLAPSEESTVGEESGGKTAPTPEQPANEVPAAAAPVLLNVYQASGTPRAYLTYQGRYYDVKAGDYLEDYLVSRINVAEGVVELEKGGSPLLLTVQPAGK